LNRVSVELRGTAGEDAEGALRQGRVRIDPPIGYSFCFDSACFLIFAELPKLPRIFDFGDSGQRCGFSLLRAEAYGTPRWRMPITANVASSDRGRIDSRSFWFRRIRHLRDRHWLEKLWCRRFRVHLAKVLVE